MPGWLLTKEEIGQTYEGAETAAAQAQLRKVAVYVKRNSVDHDFGDHTRKVTVWGREEWDALMREAGLAEADKKEV